MDWHETDLAYAAGFLDGEGSFSIVGAGNGWYKSAITCGNTYRPVLDNLQEMFGGTVTSRPKMLGRKRMYTWRIYGHQAATVAQALLPFLQEKKVRAVLLLEYEHTRVRRGSKPIPQDVQNYRIYLKARLKEFIHAEYVVE